MKEYFFTLSLFLPVVLFAQSQHFYLSGKIAGENDGLVRIHYKDKDRESKSDSCKIEDGNFGFNGNISAPTICYFWMNTPSAEKNKLNATEFFLEPTSMFISVKKDDFRNAIIKGSKTQDEYSELDKLKESIDKEMLPLSNAYDKANEKYITAIKNKEDKGTLDSLKRKADQLYSQFELYNQRMNQVDYHFFATHPDSYVTAFLLRYHLDDLTPDSLKMFYKNMNEPLRQSSYGVELLKGIQKLTDGFPGSVANDFTTKDIKGKTIKLSDFRGKYVLLDFWASWCLPCRKGNPHLKKLYTRYKSKGFEIIGVSDDDADTSAWKKAVAKDGLPWPQVLRGLDFTNSNNDLENPKDISEKYGIHTLPTQVLIDTSGIIISRYGEGSNDSIHLDKKLAEVLKGN
jgi:peroxiredoxin